MNVTPGNNTFTQYNKQQNNKINKRIIKHNNKQQQNH